MERNPLLQIPWAFIKPMSMPRLTQWANDHAIIAHLEAETVLMNLIWSESAQWLLSYGLDEWMDQCSILASARWSEAANFTVGPAT